MATPSSTRFGGNAAALSNALCGTLAPFESPKLSPIGVPAPAETPDAALLALGRAWTAMDQRCAELNAQPEGREQSWAARAMREVIGRRIAATPALTFEGLDVKALLPSGSLAS